MIGLGNVLHFPKADTIPFTLALLQASLLSVFILVMPFLLHLLLIILGLLTVLGAWIYLLLRSTLEYMIFLLRL